MISYNFWKENRDSLVLRINFRIKVLKYQKLSRFRGRIITKISSFERLIFHLLIFYNFLGGGWGVTKIFKLAQFYRNIGQSLAIFFYNFFELIETISAIL